MINKISNQKEMNGPSRKEEIPAEFKEIAEGMETEFLNHLITEMRNSVPQENEEESSSMDYYNSLLDYEYAKTMSKNNGGIGIQKLILNQIHPNSNKLNVAQNPYLGELK